MDKNRFGEPAPILLGLMVLATIPSLVALAEFGIIHTPDSAGYLAYAGQIRTGTIPSGAALLHESSMPLSLYRMGGFPALLAWLQTWFPKVWPMVLAGLQITAQAAIAPISYCAALKLGAIKRWAAIAALLPTIGFVVVTNVCVLTDSLSDAAMTCAALALILSSSLRTAILAGLLLAFATTFREATAVFTLFYIPLVFFTARKPLSVLLVVIPAWLVVGAQLGWNLSRGAGPVLTTVEQVVMVQAVLPLVQSGLPVYNGKSPFDKVANQTVRIGGFSKMQDFEKILFVKYDMTAPQIAHTASKEYFRTWTRFPLRMLWATMQNFNHVFLFMPFQPIDTAGALVVYAGEPRPVFNRLNILWRSLMKGNILAGVLIAINVISQLAGTLISLIATIGPWRARGYIKLRALWIIPAGLAALYMPVHLETRYLIPAVPLICIMAAVVVSRDTIPSLAEKPAGTSSP